MTVRFPLRISTTCDALLVSFASLPATKKPQNAPAGRAGQTSDATTMASAPTTDRFKDMPPPVCSCGRLRRARRPKDLRARGYLGTQGCVISELVRRMSPDDAP